MIRIYVLCDPNDKLKHVAATGLSIEDCLAKHIQCAKDGFTRIEDRWIRELLARGELPKIRQLCVANDARNLQQWVTIARRSNPTMLVEPRVASDETKKRMSLAHIGRPKSEETKRKIALARTGQTHSTETKLKIAASLRKRRSL